MKHAVALIIVKLKVICIVLDGLWRQTSGMWKSKLIAIFVSALTLSGFATAVPIPWSEQATAVVVKEQKLNEILKDLFESNNIASVIDPSIDAVVKNSRFKLKPQEMIDLLSLRYGLSVYYDGQTAYVAPSSSNVTRIFRIDRNAQISAKRVLSSLGLLDNKFPVRFDEVGKIVSVNGPLRLVTAIESALVSLEDPTGVANRGEVKIFPLTSGVAQDRTFRVGDGDVQILGVASLLRKIFKSQVGVQSATSGPASMRNSAVQQVDPVMNSLRAQGQSVRGMMAPDSGVPIQVRSFEVSPAQELPVIEAIPHINAVVIRDTPERLKMYDDIVKRMDIKPIVVLIEVSIVEVSTNALNELGVDWRFGNSRGGFSTSGSTSLPSSIPINGIGAALASGGIGFLSSVGASHLLQTQLSAMVAAGSAKVVSTPRIVTLLSEEGRFSNNNTFFAKVAGNLEANLFSVESGTSIRITPLNISGEDTERKMRLLVRIEDGKLLPQLVDQLPVTQKSMILTNAVISIDQSLALAGITEESTKATTRGVPGLSEIPLIGGLFRYKQDETKTVQRLFLLTPRILE
jgi:type III secretion protein C